MTVPQTDKAVDAAVEQTFPASDPAKVTPDAGLRLDPSALRAAPPGAMALRHLVVAGLQAVRGAEAASAEALRQLAPLVADGELRACMEACLGRTEQVLLRAAHALASFGQGYRTDLRPSSGEMAAGLAEAARKEVPGPALDCAAAIAAYLAERQKAAAYEVLLSLSQRIGAPDAARLLEESLAATRSTADAFAQLAADRITPEAAAAAQPALAVRTNLLAFGADLAGAA